MKYSTVLFFACGLLLLCACGNRQQPASASGEPPKTDTTTDQFFPIADYLQSEIRYVDSTPLAILKSETFNDRKDSTFLTPAEFHRLASTFLLPGLDADSLKKNYTENSFSDKTTGYLTFTYSPKDKDLPLQRVDVVVSPGRGVDKVKSIYLERVARESDTLTVTKMYWEARHSFQVITSLQPAGKTPLFRQLKVVWDAGETD